MGRRRIRPVKKSYAKGYLTRVLNSMPPGTLKRMKNCVRIGYSVNKLLAEFRVPEVWANAVYQKYAIPEKGPIEQRLGSKQEPYYEKESDMTIPEYKLEDLDPDGDEFKIANGTYGTDEGNLHGGSAGGWHSS